MKKNLGRLDRWIRILLGAAIISLAFVGPETKWAWLGLIPVATGVLGTCPLYSLFGFNTCHRARLHGR